MTYGEGVALFLGGLIVVAGAIVFIAVRQQRKEAEEFQRKMREQEHAHRKRIHDIAARRATPLTRVHMPNVKRSKE